MSILAINAGSSSLKFGLFSEPDCKQLLSADIDWAGGDPRQARFTVLPQNGEPTRTRLDLGDRSKAAAIAMEAMLEAATPGGEPITAAGHRVVHGGTEFRASVRVDAKVKAAIARWSELAPLHNPPALNAIEAAEAALPEIPQVAVFDTAFHAQLPPKAYLYGVPYSWHHDWGVRRYGFHGISHAWCVNRAAELLQRDLSELRLVTCHLGGGCTAAAVQGGLAVATTGGFSPLDGLMMGTRCGSIDPGILLHVQREQRLTTAELAEALNYSSGLKGVSGVSADLAEIEAAAAQGNARAQLAFEIFASQVRDTIASLAATLGGVDAVVFTDRIGEGSAALRAAACENLGFMGIRLDPARNTSVLPDADIAAEDSPTRILVIHTREEQMVARETLAVCRQPRCSAG